MTTLITLSFGSFLAFALPLLSIESGLRKLAMDGGTDTDGSGAADGKPPAQGGADPESARERN